MPNSEELNLAPAESTAPTPPPETEAETEAKRGRGRPTIAEIEAREQALKERQADLEAREREVALAAAEANMALREAEVAASQQKLAATQRQTEALVAGRSGSGRSGDIRSEEMRPPQRGITRRYKSSEMPDDFHIPPEQIPGGQSYQWNNHTILGQANPQYDSRMSMQGWSPVPTSRHPHLMPAGTPDNAPIIVKGQILVERPQELTQEALQEEYDKARNEVRAKEQQLYGTPAGTLPRARANGSNEFNQVNKDFEPGRAAPANYQYENTGGDVIE